MEMVAVTCKPICHFYSDEITVINIIKLNTQLRTNENLATLVDKSNGLKNVVSYAQWIAAINK